MGIQNTRMAIETPISFDEFPSDYPVYLLYVPTGMDLDSEKEVYNRLKIFGENLGENICVAQLDLKKRKYVEFLKKYEINQKPVIFLSDNRELSEKTLLIILDEPEIVSNEKKLIQLLPSLVDLMLCEDDHAAIITALSAMQKAELISVLRPAMQIFSSLKIKATLGLFTIETK